MALAALLTGCAGIRTPYERPAESGTVPYQVIPITTELLRANLAIESRAADSETQQSKGGNFPNGEKDTYFYRLGAGDVLSIYITPPLGRGTPAGPVIGSVSDEQNQYLINERGEIFLPYHGAVAVEGLTIPDAFEHVREILSRYIRSPQINLRVSEFRSQKITVVGFVEEVGTLPVTDRPLTIAEAVLLAQPKAVADLRRVQLKRNGDQRTVDLTRVMSSADFGKQMILQGGDVVLIPENTDKVFFLGEVPNRSALLPQNGASLATMLFPDGQSASGQSQVNLQSGRSLPGSIFVIRSGRPLVDVFHLNGESPEGFLLAQYFSMKPNDIVFVSTRPIVRFNRFVTQILPTIQAILAPVFLFNQADDAFDGN